jgi:isopentenyl-diphosphate Delta-isomerase
MSKDSLLSSRKSDHIRITLEEDVLSGVATGLDAYRFEHQALPEIDLDAVDLSLDLFGRKLAAPILISSMTGGTSQAAEINRLLALAAQEAGVALGLGSQRVAIEQPEWANTFQVRTFAPDILLFGNLGAVQLNYGFTSEHCLRAVEMVGADALILHLNPLQEALQPEGDVRFSGLLRKIEGVCKALPVPVIAKETGCGISKHVAKQLVSAGVAAIDVAGLGGTSWSQVEMYRLSDEYQVGVAASFCDWGVPTVESIINVRQVASDIPIIASGGIKSGVDIAKCIALGADLGGLAKYFLGPATRSTDEVVHSIEALKRQIQISMFLTGTKNLADFKNARLVKVRGVQ